MTAAEAATRDAGRSLMVLDAVTGGDAARLYERLGWTRAGDIPGFASIPRAGFAAPHFITASSPTDGLLNSGTPVASWLQGGHEEHAPSHRDDEPGLPAVALRPTV